jgi:hypothetical protein
MRVQRPFEGRRILNERQEAQLLAITTSSAFGNRRRDLGHGWQFCISDCRLLSRSVLGSPLLQTHLGLALLTFFGFALRLLHLSLVFDSAQSVARFTFDFFLEPLGIAPRRRGGSRQLAEGHYHDDQRGHVQRCSSYASCGHYLCSLIDNGRALIVGHFQRLARHFDLAFGGLPVDGPFQLIVAIQFVGAL